MSRSEQITERLFQCIHKGEIDNIDLVQIVVHIANDILNSKTKSSYTNRINPNTGKKYNYRSHKFAKGLRYEINNVEFITDNE